MKKKNYRLLAVSIIIVAVICCALGFSACGAYEKVEPGYVIYSNADTTVSGNTTSIDTDITDDEDAQSDIYFICTLPSQIVLDGITYTGIYTLKAGMKQNKHIGYLLNGSDYETVHDNYPKLMYVVDECNRIQYQDYNDIVPLYSIKGYDVSTCMLVGLDCLYVNADYVTG